MASGVRAQAPARSVWEGVYTNDQAKRGQPLYSQYCGACHGDTLGGGESAPPLAGAEFLSNWNGLTVGDLARLHFHRADLVPHRFEAKRLY